MSTSGILRWTALRLPGVDDEVRDDVLASIESLDGRRGPVGRLVEAGSLLGFALSSMTRRGTNDDRNELLRQGLRVGALVLAIATAVSMWSAAGDLASVAAATCATAAAIAIAGGARLGALSLAIATMVIEVGALRSISESTVLVAVAVAVGSRFDARPCRMGGLICGMALAAGGVIGVVLPSSVIEVAIGGTGLVVAFALLAIGWFDPRHAVAATLIGFWRLVAVDIDELGRALTAAADHGEFRLLLARWMLMSAAVLAAALVTRTAIRRCLSVFA